MQVANVDLLLAFLRRQKFGVGRMGASSAQCHELLDDVALLSCFVLSHSEIDNDKLRTSKFR